MQPSLDPATCFLSGAYGKSSPADRPRPRGRASRPPSPPGSHPCGEYSPHRWPENLPAPALRRAHSPGPPRASRTAPTRPRTSRRHPPHRRNPRKIHPFHAPSKNDTAPWLITTRRSHSLSPARMAPWLAHFTDREARLDRQFSALRSRNFKGRSPKTSADGFRRAASRPSVDGSRLAAR